MTVIEIIETPSPEPEPSGAGPIETPKAERPIETPKAERLIETPESEPPQAPPLQPAGFLRRALAFSIDLIILLFLYPILFLAGVLGMTLASGGTTPVDSVPTQISPFISAWFFLFIGYFTFFHSYGGQTPAKRLIRIKVVSDQGGPLTPFQALVRSVGYFLSAFFFGFGFLLSIFEKKGRALHDLLSRSQVVLS